MTDQKQDTINIDGVEYNYADLSENVKYFIAQINDLKSQMDIAKARLDQLSVANKGFLDLLKAEMEKPKEGELADKVVN
jgi:5'-deoxynucleotidase YfbR-like HD superfamily hydrolase